jgi:tetratricopeptide (TPR) repeat protein
MRRIFLLLFAVPGIGSTLLAQNIAEDKASLYKYAVEMYNESKFELTITNCDAITRRGGDLETYKLRAKAYRAMGDFNNAIKDYTSALSLYMEKFGKKDPSMCFDRGTLYVCQKKFDYALVDFNDARRLFRQGGKENFLYLEEIGRASHYREENRSAIEMFKMAIQLGSLNTGTFVNLASSLFSSNNFPELKNFTDSLLVMEIYDSSYYYYLYALNDIASNNINSITLDKINNAIRSYRTSNQSCFQGEYFDMIYARGYVYSFLQNDAAAFEDYRVVAKNNTLLKSVLLKTNELKLKLGLDIAPPAIVLRNPQVDIDRRATIKATKRKYKFFGQVTDSSGVSSITVTSNDRDLPPITSIEAGGIFEFNIDLNPGINKIVISAVDRNENASSEAFTIDFEERMVAAGISDSAFADDIPEINNNINYFALLIAEKEYDDEGFKDLQTPIDDASEVSNILINQYDFAESNVKLLTNATRQMIIDTLSTLCKMMTDADNLLIFYAGHGDEKRTNGEIVGGYIIPSDAKKDNRATYISNQDLVEPVLNTQARHVLFVVDACFAGLMRSTMDDAPQGIKNLYNNKSRRILTSGNREQVPDGGQFIYNFKNYLRNPGKVYLTANELYTYIVDNNSTSNTPIYERISNTGDVSIGQFIFKKVR